jgi:hypothetical protein
VINKDVITIFIEGKMGALPQVLAAIGAIAAVPQIADSFAVQAIYDGFYQPDNLLFPTDLNLGVDTPYITFRFEEYIKRSIYETVSTVVNNDQNKTIRLPIPRNLQDNFSVSYSQENLGPGVGAAAEGVAQAARGGSVSDIAVSLARGVYGGAGGLALQTLEATLENLRAPAAAGSVGRNIASSVGGGAYNALQALSGLAPNPFQTILFKNPNFKKHQFSWTFVPKEEKESEVLRKIIDVFQYNMLPGISRTSSILFTYPGLVKIFLNPTPKYLYQFKPCVIESFSVNYAPNGPAFYRKTTAPAAINISISLQEVELWTKNDFLSKAPSGLDRILGRPQPQVRPIR